MAKVPLVIRNDEELEAALDRAEALYGTPNSSERQIELAAIAEAVHVYTDAMRVPRNLPAAARRPFQKRGYDNA